MIITPYLERASTRVNRFFTLDAHLKPAVKWGTNQREEMDDDRRLGLATGDGLVVIDLDRKNGKDGVASFESLASQKGQVPATLVIATKSGGWHVYFTCNCETKNSAGKIGDGIDVRGDGGYVVVPPSEGYKVIKDVPIAFCPDWLLALVKCEHEHKPPVEAFEPTNGSGWMESRIARNMIARIAQADQGTRNDTLFRQSFAMLSHCIANQYDLPVNDLIAAGRKAGLSDTECRLTVESALSKAQAKPESMRGSDDDKSGSPMMSKIKKMVSDRPKGRAKKESKGVEACALFSDQFERVFEPKDRAVRLQFYDSNKRGNALPTYVWSKTRWAQNATYCRMIIQKKLRELGEEWDSAAVTRIEEILWDSCIMDVGEEFFNVPDNYVFFEDCIIDAVNRTKIEYSPEIHNLFNIGTRFNANAPYPLFMKFLGEVIPGDCIGFLQQWFGAALAGIRTDRMLILVGESAGNGKSVLMGLMGRIFGDMAVRLTSDDLSNRQAREITGAKLIGKSLALVDELSKEVHIRDDMIKDLVTSERIAARKLYSDGINVDNRINIIIATNYTPPMNAADNGIWRRISVIDMNFRPPKIDTRLLEKLWSEREGIANWLLDGAKAYLENGLIDPASVITATANLREESSRVRTFIADHCERMSDETTIENYTPAACLYEMFASWCKINGYNPLNHRNFAIELAAIGVKKIRRGQGNMYFLKTIKESITFIDDRNSRVTREFLGKYWRND